MLPAPEQPLSVKSLPWVCMGFFLVYLTLFLTVQKDELRDQQALARWYQQSGLFELEWDNYISWLRISGQVAKAEDLEKARADHDALGIFRAMAFDPGFERENRLRGDQYWDLDERLAWEENRETFRTRSRELPSVSMGLNPAAPRPSTYLTWHFLHESPWQWLVALLVLIPFAWPVEAELGPKRMAIIWMVAGVASGLVYVALLQDSYQPLIGATPLAAAVIGMYLSLFGMRRLPFRWFHPKAREWRELRLPAAVLAPLWFVLPAYEYVAGSPAPHVWVAQLAGLLAGAGLVQLVRRSEVAGTESDEGEEEAEDARRLRQHLTSGWASMSALSFREAEQEFTRALGLSPGHFGALTGLYQIHKLRPDSDRFHETARAVLAAPADSEGEIRQQLGLYRDYRKRAPETSLPLETEVLLLMRFTRVGELRDAEKLATELGARQAEDELLVKAFLNLSHAFGQYNNSTKAARFGTLAENLKARLASAGGA